MISLLQIVLEPVPLSHNFILHLVHDKSLPASHIVLKLALVILAIMLVE